MNLARGAQLALLITVGSLVFPVPSASAEQNPVVGVVSDTIYFVFCSMRTADELIEKTLHGPYAGQWLIQTVAREFDRGGFVYETLIGVARPVGEAYEQIVASALGVADDAVRTADQTVTYLADKTNETAHRASDWLHGVKCVIVSTANGIILCNVVTFEVAAGVPPGNPPVEYDLFIAPCPPSEIIDRLASGTGTLVSHFLNPPLPQL